MPENPHQETILAVYSMLRGFLNAMDAQDPTCSDLFICEAARESAQLGNLGQIAAKIGR